MNYSETIEFLYAALPVFQREGASAYKPGLEGTRAFLALLGDPQAGLECVHVAGTNGKGSTSHSLASCLQASGRRTGLFTSPHLRDFRERIRVDGEMIPEGYVVAFVERWRGEMVARGLTFFEMCTALSFAWFAELQVDIAVIETGLGGRLDATNVIAPRLSIITNIGLEHTAQLGDTVQSIAAEKAGIIKPGVPVIIGCHDAAVDAVFEGVAGALGCPLLFADDMYSLAALREDAESQTFTVTSGNQPEMELETDLMGHYQRLNLPAVLAACRILGVGREAVLEGCRSVRRRTGLAGRWQVLSREPLTVCDTGHNAHGIKEVVAQIARQRYRRLYFVLGVVADKDLEAILPLLPARAHYIFTQPSSPRALDCSVLAAAASRFCLRGETCPTVPEALSRARALASSEDMIFVGGSTFTVADII